MSEKNEKIVQSEAKPLKILFADKYTVDFYQREYVWQEKQIEDLINDLSTEFLKCWTKGDDIAKVQKYDPYFMGEIVLSSIDGKNAIIDGQQRITTFTLLLIYLLKKFGDIENFPKSEIEKLIYDDYYGEKRFNIEIEERKNCMLSLFHNGKYELQNEDNSSIENLVNRYNDIEDCWNSKINNENIVNFTYWIKEKIIFSKVWTNDDEFAYVIFETMNDRGLSLTQIEMLKSYLLAKIDNTDDRTKSKNKFESIIENLKTIKLSSKSKAEFEFFKIFLRGHYANDNTSGQEPDSDFARIGKEFHRWVRDNTSLIGLNRADDYKDFINRIEYYANIYKKINIDILNKNVDEYFYLVVNGDYNFTLQPELILAAIDYKDDDDTVKKKIQVVTKFITKILSWRIWNNKSTAQNKMDSLIYDLCKKIRKKNVNEISDVLNSYKLEDTDELENAPILNHQNKNKLKVLISLITEIVARNSKESNYILKKENIEVEHIWSDHFNEHTDEFTVESEFNNARNTIGDLLVLPKSFNGSYGDDPYESKLIHYYEQNILAQTLNVNKYTNNPGFIEFKNNSGLKFVSYEHFKHKSIIDRSELYKNILIWNFNTNTNNN